MIHCFYFCLGRLNMQNQFTFAIEKVAISSFLSLTHGIIVTQKTNQIHSESAGGGARGQDELHGMSLSDLEQVISDTSLQRIFPVLVTDLRVPKMGIALPLAIALTLSPRQTSSGELGWRLGGGASGFSRSSSTNDALPSVANARPNSAAAAAAVGGGFLGDGTISGWDSDVFQVGSCLSPVAQKQSNIICELIKQQVNLYPTAGLNHQCRFPNPHQFFPLDSVSVHTSKRIWNPQILRYSLNLNRLHRRDVTAKC